LSEFFLLENDILESVRTTADTATTEIMIIRRNWLIGGRTGCDVVDWEVPPDPELPPEPAPEELPDPPVPPDPDPPPDPNNPAPPDPNKLPRFGKAKFSLGRYWLMLGKLKLKLNFGRVKLKWGKLNPSEPPPPDNPNPDPDPDPNPVPPPEPLDPPPEVVPLVPGLLEMGCICVMEATRSHVTIIIAKSDSRIVFEANNN
jgi:hypothetical protein